MLRSIARFALLPLVLLPLACSSSDESDVTTASDNHLTGANSTQRGFHFQSYVYVPTTASDGDIQTAIARQVKSGIGALRTPEVSMNDRDAQHNLDPSKWKRQTLTVVDPSNASFVPYSIEKVTFSYDDVAVVTNSLSSTNAVSFTMLAGDYGSYAGTLIQKCSDDTTTDVDSLWYHYTPQMTSCASLVTSELAAIGSETSAIHDSSKVGPHEVGRWFMPVTAQLDAPQLPNKSYSPEYDRLYGMGTDKSKVIVYAFFGVDTDESNPDDILGQEAVKFLRTMLRAQPNFRPTFTNPGTMLEDVYVGGQKVPNVTYDAMFSWILDQRGYPAMVGSDAGKIAELRKAAMSAFTERWIYWDLPVTVSDAAHGSKDVTIEVRTFYGYEDGTADARQHAEWRYLEAFWYGDVFLYNGHSHFGHGPLEPFLYGPQNFNDRYQIMLVDSCISYNYYHEDFFAMKPGGSKNLDMVLNGLPAYVNDMGVATANFLDGLIDGKQHTYLDLLKGMEIDEPWGENNYDPMRVVDGELDNAFAQTSTPITVKVGAPVY